MLSGPALAGCPTAADLETGIRFAIAGGETETFTRFGPHLLQSDYDSGDGVISRIRLARGLYLVEVVDIVAGDPVPGSRSTYTFPADHADLPSPDPNTVWEVDVLAHDDGFQVEHHRYRFGPLAEVSLGRCRYDMVPIIVTYGPEDATTDFLNWLPKLGLSYLVRSTWDEGEDRYDYQDVDAVQPVRKE